MSGANLKSLFLGRTYDYNGRILGVCNILCNKLYVLGLYDPKTGQYTLNRPLTPKGKELQAKLDDLARECELQEVQL